MVEDIDICSILVTTKVVRTCKFLCAVARGIPIVSRGWLLKIKSNRFKMIDTDDYILNDPATEQRFAFNLKQSLGKYHAIINRRQLLCSSTNDWQFYFIDAASIAPLFKGYTIFVTPGVRPPPAEISGESKSTVDSIRSPINSTFL